MTMGSLYWQIDDVWPTMSWSTVDYYGRWKAAHYRVRDAFAPHVILPEATADSVFVRVLAETSAGGPQSLGCVWDLRLMTLDGDIINHTTIQQTIPTGQVYTLWAKPRADWPVLQDSARVLLYCQMRTGGQVVAENVLYFARPRALALMPFDVQPVVQPVADGFQLVVTSPVLLKGVHLTAGVEGFFSDNYFDLLPGVSRTIHFKPANGIIPAQVSFKARSLADPY
jgi:beta-mannosidase